MNEKLLPCRCGAPGRLVYGGPCVWGSCSVGCENDLVQGSVPEAIAAWNRRAPSRRLEALERVAAAAKDYTTERGYQNVQACREDQDRREKVLLDALAALKENEQ